MAILEIILGIFIFRYLRSSKLVPQVKEEWDNYFLAGMVVMGCLAGLYFSSHRSRPVVAWFSHALMLSILLTILRRQEFASVRSLSNSLLPLVAVDIVSDGVKLILPSYFSGWSSYLEIAQNFAVVWMIAVWTMARRQRKALEKERLKAVEKEQKFQESEAMKAALEVQVAERTSALTAQKEELEQIVKELKATQAQLVQSEKMASLGELTAGIAHEIQNPLNFVNNFSEVNAELAVELKAALEQGDTQEALVLAADIVANEQKITHHGKRADAIVKGMLQHSRSSTGQKEPTDINALADEYLRLAYHGLRAKDKSFNASMKTEFDESIRQLTVIPQDIGRVILNLITNAFYAVTEKKKQLVKAGDGKAPGFDPTVTVQTMKKGNSVLVRVKDNGNGIPAAVMDKIFMPFFTTKPTGEGTGLGLSMSYDIVTKGHGGTLTVSSVVSEGSAFTISLPA
jgi:two-component system NtrC family sensor kinase